MNIASSVSDRKSARCSNEHPALIVGIGSAHGDDQAGWKAIELLEQLNLKGVDLRKASVPHDLIDWLDEIFILHIVDSCTAASDCSGPSRYIVEQGVSSHSPSFAEENEARLGILLVDSNLMSLEKKLVEPTLQLRSAGSHQLDVLTILELARTLRRLPPKIVLWAIPGTHFCPGELVSEECTSAIAKCVSQLSEEFCDA